MKNKQLREPIATWYRIASYSVEIRAVDVVEFTVCFVTYIDRSWGISERRERRNDIFPTFDEAKAEAVRRASVRVEAAKRELHDAKSRLGQWESVVAS